MAYLYVGATRTHTIIQSAVDVAVDGDVIVVDPGTYNENIHCTTAVSFRANTENPITNPVYWHGPTASTETLEINISPGVPKTVYVEGFTFTKASTAWTRTTRFIGDSQTRFFINKCKITAGSSQYPIGAGDVLHNTFEVKNCHLIRGYAHFVGINWNTPVHAIEKCHLNNAYTCQSCIGSPTSSDYVTTTSAGYGPEYGEFYIGTEIGYFDGYVFQEGLPVVRTVRLHERESGLLINETTSSGDGYYQLTTTTSGSHYIVCLDDAAEPAYNDLIIGNVYPTTYSGV